MVKEASKFLKQYRNVSFTLHNPTKDEVEKFTNFLTVLPSGIRYIVFQTEMTFNNTVHFQGYCEFEKSHRIGGVKKILSERCHIERRKGTQEQAIDYCTKEKTRTSGPRGENGTPKRQRRDSIRNVTRDIRNGVDREELKERYPIQELLHRERINQAYIQEHGPRNLVPSKNNVHIYVGPAGSGKTTTAKMLHPNAYRGVWPTGGRWWWPNYEGQKVVILDEFRENISYQQILNLLDIHPMILEYKGGNSHLISEKIIITTIRDPKTWYKAIPDKSELERRINENCTIFDFTPGKKYPNFEKKAREGRFIFDAHSPCYRGYNNESHYFNRNNHHFRN